MIGKRWNLPGRRIALTPRAFPRAPDKRAEARANIRRPNSLEFNVSNTSACETAIVNLRRVLPGPFFIFTNVVSKSKDITIHTVFGIYNALFNYIEKSKA
ncbi:uncharacterized protein N7496_004504 [Penicillium cataractarum]|uniref:Uncharacterized protein n=1 Tax=Penicillium cataractarum TaxID=2100454 RepID=A0A9W9VJW2_9EURO|nr:uncharacterized protein N7496_004504 [Penicillium cataractarum]KAJ5382076.1 hypothetical protein N7496_004504 [Penicillium cataractarum]